MKTPPKLLVTGLTLLVLSTLNLKFSTVFAQGSLTPPGAPAATMKTLQQVEPRTPIASLPFNITNAGSCYIATNLTGPASQSGITIATGDVSVFTDSTSRDN